MFRGEEEERRDRRGSGKEKREKKKTFINIRCAVVKNRLSKKVVCAPHLGQVLKGTT